MIDFYNEEKDPGIGMKCMLFVTKFLSDPFPTSSKQKKEPCRQFWLITIQEPTIQDIFVDLNKTDKIQISIFGKKK